MGDVLMEMARCFGGTQDGKLVKLGEKVIAIHPPLPPMPLAIDGLDSAPCTVDAPRPDWYRLRSVRSGHDEVYFYALDEWDDITALRRALG